MGKWSSGSKTDGLHPGQKNPSCQEKSSSAGSQYLVRQNCYSGPCYYFDLFKLGFAIEIRTTWGPSKSKNASSQGGLKVLD